MTNDTNQTVLIVEDEPDLARLLEQYVANSGYKTKVINNGLDVEPWLSANNANLIILDLMLPGKSGLDICQEIRSTNQTPIIITTAKVEEIDRLLGLEIGADDYICKPYSPKEVVARIKTVLRRVDASLSPSASAATDALIDIDLDKLHISVGTTTIELTQIEINLFKLLYDEPGKIFSRQQILDNIYHDYRIVSDRTVDSHIKKLRKKLHDALPDRDLIKSIYGAGYKFEPEVTE